MTLRSSHSPSLRHALPDACWLVFAINATALSLAGIGLWQAATLGFEGVSLASGKSILMVTAAVAVPLSLLAAEHILSVRALTERLAELDPVDPATGVLRPGVFKRILEDETERLERTGRTSAIATLHLDHHAWFAREFGNAVADTALTHVARIAHSQLRTSFDKIARWSETDLIVLLDDAVIRDAETYCDRVCDAVAEAGFDHGGQWYGITVSCGIASFGPGRPAASAIDKAGSGIDKARRYGGNRRFTIG